MGQKLKPEQLKRTYDPAILGCETTEGISPLTGIIGQERASRALNFGLHIESVGFNMYVAGPPGIGKMTAVQQFLQQVALEKDSPGDWIYVNGFDDNYQPRALTIPQGQGIQLHNDIKHLIRNIRRDIPRAFEGEEYLVKSEEIVKALQKQREELLETLNVRAMEAGFSLQPSQVGVMVVPVKDGKPMTEPDFQALPEAEREEIKAKRDQIQDDLNAAMKHLREMEKVYQKQLEELDQLVAIYVVGGSINELREKYSKLPQILEYLQAMQKDILENINNFRAQPEAQPPRPDQPPWLEEVKFRKYEVNLLVDNSEQGAPVTVELNPTYGNLFGKIEKETQFGSLYTDHTMIKPGSLHRANGGFLVLPAEDVLRNLLTWESLKRALESSEIQIEDVGERLGYVATKSLKPEPIPLDVKVVLVGRPMLYYLLHANDEDFPELFKVKADFATRMDVTDENVKGFSSFICGICESESLKHLESGAIARVLEYAARLADDQEKLSTHFGAIADLIREANYWAEQSKSEYISAEHIGQALEEKVYRANLIQEQMREMIERGTVLIDTSGADVGQVNGLAVLGLGDHSFGKPSRITASVSPGREGIVDIEREVQMGGAIHSKGVLILNGYLKKRFAQKRPLTLSARLVFEQSYSGVDGDSASSTELYALLSALSDIPIKQGIAVTGSVNQNGEVQAIGGVNQKIEGFYDICVAQGLTGEQGAMIPESNVKNLMLREDIIAAVQDGKFHIWSVSNIEEGIEILTGVSAGERDLEGIFPPDSVYGKVEKRFDELADALQNSVSDQRKAEASPSPAETSDLPPDPEIPRN